MLPLVLYAAGGDHGEAYTRAPFAMAAFMSPTTAPAQLDPALVQLPVIPLLSGTATRRIERPSSPVPVPKKKSWFAVDMLALANASDAPKPSIT